MNKVRMSSVINWALLGLVIERPSYIYELAMRFERIYDSALTLASVSHAYTALATLHGHGLVEEIPGPRSGRQPKPHYRVTALGRTEHARWVLSQVVRERHSQRVLLQQFAVLALIPERAGIVLDAYERVHRDELAATSHIVGEGRPGASGLRERLIIQETRLVIPGKLEWANYAREQLDGIAHTGIAAAKERPG